MQGSTKERWMELAELVAKEQNSEKLIVLVEELNRLLKEKERRLYSKKPTASVDNRNAPDVRSGRGTTAHPRHA